MNTYHFLKPTPEDVMAEHQRCLRRAVWHMRLAGLYKPLTIVVLPLLVLALAGVTAMLWGYNYRIPAYAGPSADWVKHTANYTTGFVLLSALSLFWLTTLHFRSYQIIEIGGKVVKALEELAAWGLTQLADKDAPIETQMAALAKKIQPRFQRVATAAMMTDNYTQALLEEVDGKVWKSTEPHQSRILDIANPAEIMLSWLGWVGIGLALNQSLRPLYHLYFFFTTIWSS